MQSSGLLHRSWRLSLVALLLASSGVAAAAPEWTPLGRSEGYFFGTRAPALVAWNDGTGPALFLGGDFSTVGSALGTGVVKFDGEKYSPLGCGIVGLDPLGWSNVMGNVSYSGEVETLHTWDPDGAGPLGTALVAGGRFGHAGGQTVNNVAVWDGSAWSTLGNGLGMDTGLVNDGIYSRVYDLETFDDGEGAKLYACGIFQLSNGQNVGRWNGSDWEAVGGSLPGWAQGMCVHNDGTGAALYVCGRELGGVYKLSGGTWVNIAGVSGTPAAPDVAPDDYRAMASFDPDGAGPAPAVLCVGGRDGGLGLKLWTWSGGTWTARPFAVANDPNTQVYYNQIVGMTVFDDGTGPALYMTAGNAEIGPSLHARGYSTVHKWNGTTFSTYGAPKVFAAGETIPGSSASVPVVSSVDGAAKIWFTDQLGGIMKKATAATTLPSVATTGYQGAASDAVMFDPDGAGPAPARLYCLSGVNGVYSLQTFDGQTFQTLAVNPLPATPEFESHQGAGEARCTVFNDGTGDALYVSVTESAGTSVYKLVGSSWVSLGAPGTFYAFNSGVGLRSDRINDLIGFNDGSGMKLYATGRFTTVGGVTCNHIARWNGAAWEPVGPTSPTVGLRAGFAYDNLGAEFRVFDDGSGPALYVAGRHDGAGSVMSPRVVRWNGTAWQGVGSFFTATMPSPRIVVHDSGMGAQMFAGNFDGIFGVEGDIVRWNGTDWVSASAGLNFGQDVVELLGSFDNGCGRELYAVGSHIEDYVADSTFNSLTGYWLYRWDGAMWARVPETFSIGSAAMSTAFEFNMPAGRGMLISGNYGGVGGSATNCGTASMIPSALTAVWGCPVVVPPCAADFNGANGVTADDIFAFLDAWFAQSGMCTGTCSADFNASGTVTADDIFAFLDAWFAGCP